MEHLNMKQKLGPDGKPWDGTTFELEADTNPSLEPYQGRVPRPVKPMPQVTEDDATQGGGR